MEQSNRHIRSECDVQRSRFIHEKRTTFYLWRVDIIVTFIMKEFCESMNLFIRKGQNFYQRMQRKSFPTPPISVLPIAVPLKTKRIYSTLAKSPKTVPFVFFLSNVNWTEEIAHTILKYLSPNNWFCLKRLNIFGRTFGAKSFF